MSSGAAYPAKSISILAPGSTGGGWDTRARAIQAALGECNVTDENVTVSNLPGAGGTIGLAKFVTHEKDPYQLMVMDTVTMLGGIIRNNSPYDLSDLTPVAGLTVATSAIVVPADSQYKNLDQLMAALKADPRSVPWTGGSLGGPDHILAALLAKSQGARATDINYVATGGGGEVVSLLLSGSAKAAVSTLTELRPQIEAGKLRALAFTGDKRVEGIEAPTLAELHLDGIDVSSTGGILAPPGVSEEDAKGIIAMVEKLHGTDCWKEALKRNNWVDTFLPGQEFADVIKQNQSQVSEVLNELGLTAVK
jgi:putative tricarboxylic transport membrane protein